MTELLPPIVCQRCKERRPPVVKRGMFCVDCWRKMEAESEARIEAKAPTSIFSRNDGSIYD